MKALLISLLIVLVGMACRSDDAGPVEPLYKTWKRQLGTYQGQPAPYETVYKNLLVEFRTDGQLAYGEGKAPGGCCLPARFQTDQSTLRFGGLISCSTVRCAAPELTSGIDWQIETLTATDLIIRTDKQRIVFTAQ